MEQSINSRRTLFLLLKIALIPLILIGAVSVLNAQNSESRTYAIYLPTMQYHTIPTHVTTRRKSTVKSSETILVQLAEGVDSTQFLTTYSEHIIDQNPSLGIIVLRGTADVTTETIQVEEAVAFAQADRNIVGNPRQETSFGNQDVEAESQDWIGAFGDGLTQLVDEGTQYTSPTRLIPTQGYSAWINSHGDNYWIGSHGDNYWIGSHGDNYWIGSHGDNYWIGSHGDNYWIGSHGDNIDLEDGTVINLTEDEIRARLGTGVTVAVVDTGIDLAHPLFDGRLVSGYDILAGDVDPSEEGQSADSDEDGMVNEAAGHGTHVAGIVVQVAPGAKIMPVRILDADGRGSYADLIKGIVWATDHGADIINLSVSGEEEMSFLRSALDYAAERNVTVIASGGSDKVGYPAAWDDVVGVAAVGRNNRPMDFSNYGANEGQLIDLYAPGEAIYSAYYHPDTDVNYASWSGNSMATPFVTGVAALIKSANRDCSADCIKASLRDTGRPANTPTYSYKNIDALDAFSQGVGSSATGLILSAKAIPNENQNAIEPTLLLTNTGRSIPLNQVKIRYWYSASTSAQTVTCTAGCDNMTSTIGANWLELAWADEMDTMLWGGEDGREIGVRVSYDDLRPWDPTNDYSNITSTTYETTERITVYVNGNLAWGEEPQSALSVSSVNRMDTPNNSTIQPHLRLHNHADAPIDLNDMTLRYYLGAEDAADLIIRCDYAEIGCGNISTAISENDENALIVTFDGMLDANASSDFNLRLHYANFAPIDETVNYSYNGQRSDYMPHHSVTLTVQDQLMWGIAP